MQRDLELQSVATSSAESSDHDTVKRAISPGSPSRHRKKKYNAFHHPRRTKDGSPAPIPTTFAKAVIFCLRAFLCIFAVALHPLRSHRSAQGFAKKVALFLLTVLTGVLALLLWFAFVAPSYSRPPAHYSALARHAYRSNSPGRANSRHEKVFLAVSLFDPEGLVAGGQWAQYLVELIDLLGPTNTFLSIYESDSGEAGLAALRDLEARIQCSHKFVTEPTIPLDQHVGTITLPDGSPAVKRIEYLAAARNRALDPLNTATVRYDKLLYLNDILFDPVEAAQLLFSTHLQPSGRTSYKAACAADFVSPWLYYDTFATRDSDGRGLGLPIYPWFAPGLSRQDALGQSDAIRVKACWGGMVAFDAKYFQPSPPTSNSGNSTPGARDANLPVRFRADPDLYWEYSECCLVHADILAASPQSPDGDTGIYMNPYVRTAYTPLTFFWLGLSRRVERLYVPLQWTVNCLWALPFYNERRTLKTGERIWKTVWRENGTVGRGVWEKELLEVGAGEYCGVEEVFVRRLGLVEGASRNWETLWPARESEKVLDLG